MRPKILIPDGIKIYQSGNAHQVVRRWYSFSSKIWDKFVAGVGFFGITTGVFILGLKEKKSVSDLIWFLVPFFLASSFLLYSSLLIFLNQTSIKISHGWISILHFPLPWPQG